ncbi:SRPBCC family protein [Zoogloea sp.]|uniref:SRPBCC family protein n=1 Tax=Zoogloea sp. TaxID=49181 RepID=UPI0035B13C2D
MNNKTTLFLATLALATALPAQAGKALTVREHIDISAPPAKVWDTVRDFGSLAWHPAVATTVIDKGEKDKRGAVRTVTTKDGATLVEELVSHRDSERQLKYRIIDSPLPVSGYVSTLKVRSAKGGSRVEWSSTFERKGAEAAAAKDAVRGIYTSGLGGLKQQLEAAK